MLSDATLPEQMFLIREPLRVIMKQAPCHLSERLVDLMEIRYSPVSDTMGLRSC